MDTAEIWKSTDRRRRRYLPGNLRIMSNGLTKAIQPILDSFGEFTNAEDMADEAPNKLDDRYIEQSYLELYQRTSPEFATLSYRQARGEKSEAMLRDIWAEEIERYIAAGVVAERIVHVASTTRNRVRSIIQKGIDQGMSIPQIASNIDELGLPQVIRNRSTVIARTETINASNRGAVIGAQSTGLDLNKIWIATADDRTRDDHAEADGQTVDQSGMFNVGGEELEYPGDPRGSARNVIQCRCAVAFDPK